MPPQTRKAAAPSKTKLAGKSIIAQFNAAHDLAAVLESYGYTRTGKRFASPDTRHAPGLVLLDEGRIFCHHAGDPLGDGKPHDVFDVFAIFEHRGNTRAAVKAAAHILGLNQQERMA
jgi:putative DNA primase/helicase